MKRNWNVAVRYGVTMNTDRFADTRGLKMGILYAVLARAGNSYHVYGPGIRNDMCWVHGDYLNFEGPPCMFKKEV